MGQESAKVREEQRQFLGVAEPCSAFTSSSEV